MEKHPGTILIADDDPYVRTDLQEILAEMGPRLLLAHTAKETLQKTLAEHPDLVLLDLKFPDCADLSLLKKIRTEAPGTDVIIISSQTETPQIVEAIKLGAYDYVGKPFVPDELRNRVEKVMSQRLLSQSQLRLLNDLKQYTGADCLIGESAMLQQVRELIRKFTDSEACVLIRGESGTGKELVARALHYAGKRRDRPFIVVNCAAIPEALVESVLFGHRKGAFTGAVENAKGRFEAAEDGTLFLDEIGDMPLAQQASLLRVLEYRHFTPIGENRERECHARFVLATNRDLRECVRLGRFREDLFYRIKVASIEIPPLRARPSDVALLTEFYCRRLSRDMGRRVTGVAPEVVELFSRHAWPGNVRELKNTIEAAIMLCAESTRELTLDDLPADLRSLCSSSPSPETQLTGREALEKSELERVLRQCAGNQTEAGRLLGWHRNTVRAKIRYYGIQQSGPGG